MEESNFRYLWNTTNMYLNTLNKIFTFTQEVFRCITSLVIEMIYISKSFKGF